MALNAIKTSKFNVKIFLYDMFNKQRVKNKSIDQLTYFYLTIMFNFRFLHYYYMAFTT